jgi:hypothetical protein
MRYRSFEKRVWSKIDGGHARDIRFGPQLRGAPRKRLNKGQWALGATCRRAGGAEQRGRGNSRYQPIVPSALVNALHQLGKVLLVAFARQITRFSGDWIEGRATRRCDGGRE